MLFQKVFDDSMSGISSAFADEIDLRVFEEGGSWGKMVFALIPTYVRSQIVQLFMTLDLAI